MKLWQGIVAGLGAYLVLLVATAPADRLLPLLQPSLPGVQLQGIGGTIWSGSALQAAAGAVWVQDLRWSFRPLALFTGKTEIAVRGQLRGRELRARAGRRWFGHPYLSDVQGSIDAQDLLARAKAVKIAVQGYLELDLEDVRWTEARFPAIAGTVVWSPARVVTPVELVLGRAKLAMQLGENGMSLGKLVSSDGSLLVDADVELNSGGSYRLDAVIRQNGDVAPEVANFLSTFTEYRDGAYHFDWSDSF